MATARYPAGFGINAAVTSGRVSRLFAHDGDTYIQTDTVISPGSSGGPLVDACGRVVGIVSFKLVDEGFEGLGFALAGPTARERLETVRAGPSAADIVSLLQTVGDRWEPAITEANGLVDEWNSAVDGESRPSPSLVAVTTRQVALFAAMTEFLRGLEDEPALGLPVVRNWWRQAIGYWDSEFDLAMLMQAYAQATAEWEAVETAQAEKSVAFGRYEGARCSVAEHFQLESWTRADGTSCY